MLSSSGKLFEGFINAHESRSNEGWQIIKICFTKPEHTSQVLNNAGGISLLV